MYICSQKDRPCASRSSAQVHELPWGHWRIDNNRKGILCVFLTTNIFYAHLTSVRFEHSVCHESLLTSFIINYIYKINDLSFFPTLSAVSSGASSLLSKTINNKNYIEKLAGTSIHSSHWKQLS